MMFKDLKQGCSVHILDRDKMEYGIGKVTAVSFPRMDMNAMTGKSSMVVDITIDWDGKSAVYVFPENSTISNTKNLTITPDRQLLVNELEMVKSESQRVLDSVEKHREILEKTDKLLVELNPTLREKKEIDERFDAIAKAIEGMQEVIKGQGNSIQRLLDRSTSV